MTKPRTAEDLATEVAIEIIAAYVPDGYRGEIGDAIADLIARALHEYAAQVLEDVFESAGDKSSLAAWLRLAERREREASSK